MCRPARGEGVEREEDWDRKPASLSLGTKGIDAHVLWYPIAQELRYKTIMRFTKTASDLAYPGFWLATTAFLTALVIPGLTQSPAVQSGDTIAFMGDSITEGGWGFPVGYVRLVMSALESNGIKAKAIPAGISGHNSNNMLERLRRDVLDKKPTWLTSASFPCRN